MVFKYVKAKNNYKHIAQVFLILAFVMLLIGNLGKGTLLKFAFVLFSAMFFYSLDLYFRKFSLVTDDNGIQINYYFKTIRFQWSEIISVKKRAPALFRLITNKGSLRFNPYGLLPAIFNSEEEENAGKKAETILFREIAQKAPNVQFINIPKELLEYENKK